MQVICSEIAHGSQEYLDTVSLRNELLRKPLGLVFKQEDLAQETGSFHLAAYNIERELLACLVLKPLNSTEIKMRQVATATAWQGKGVGQQLVKYAEQFAIGKGYSTMLLHARQGAIPFYDKLNYEHVGGVFQEVGIPHQKMRKRLNTPS